ncbi:hypothetical protein AAG570_001932 [Ranatra chinensis]|uniref:Major facilitator superfamily (MFS) profile domain-containing protein n=1 Tax=Ranatra chinensis TaxID=642074 RepID=A0ABD0YNX8_9HEMI
MYEFLKKCIFSVTADGVTYSFGVFYNELLTYFNEGKGATSWIASILVGVTLCSGPISSALVNKYGCREVTIAGALLAGVSLSISALANSVLVLYLTVGLLTGLGLGLIYLPAIVSVTCYFEKYRSLATGIAVCGSGLGTFIMAPVTEKLVEGFGWRGAMLITGGLMFNCVVFGILFRPLEHPKTPSKAAVEDGRPADPKCETLTVEKEAVRRPHSVHGHASIAVGEGHRATANGNSEICRLALSQPMLSQERRTSKGGIMYRKDVLYSGSLANLSKPRLDMEYRKSEEKSLMKKSVDETGNDSGVRVAVASETEVVCGCFDCSPETADGFREMLDLSLLKDPIFIIFTISNFCTSIGFNVPYVYIVPQAGERGIDASDASKMLAVIGVANTFGRIILGYVSDKPWVNRLHIYIIALSVCGFSTALSAFCTSFYSFVVYSVAFGFTAGAYVGLTSVILVDLLGLDKLTNAFGLLLMFQGIASLIGPPITGWLYDATKSYDPGFIVSGVMIAISGLMLYGVPPLQRWTEARRRRMGLNSTNNKPVDNGCPS